MINKILVAATLWAPNCKIAFVGSRFFESRNRLASHDMVPVGMEQGLCNISYQNHPSKYRREQHNSCILTLLIRRFFLFTKDSQRKAQICKILMDQAHAICTYVELCTLAYRQILIDTSVSLQFFQWYENFAIFIGQLNVPMFELRGLSINIECELQLVWGYLCRQVPDYRNESLEAHFLHNTKEIQYNELEPICLRTKL